MQSNSNNSHLKCDLLLQGYTYEDIREQELKCKAENREFKYDAATNTWSCPPTRYDGDSLSDVIVKGAEGEVSVV